MKKNKSNVWVVMKGSNYENGSVVAVTRYRTTARSVVRKIKNDDDFDSRYEWADFFGFEVMEVVE